MAGTLADLGWYGFKLGFGLFSLASIWSTAAIKSGALWARDSEKEKQELAAAQKKHWSLDQEPLPGFKHAFFKTSAGPRLHYVVNENLKLSAPKNVAIFIHGFPDSFLLWRHILQSPELLRSHILIAVDLPGYGGSDGLSAYDSYEVLETLSEFIIGMRELFLQENKKVVVVTHDWGAIIGARLASEAKELADHWVITSALIPHLTASNAAAQVSLAKQMLHTWIRSPFNIRLLKNGLHALGPVVSQFRRSFYIFCFLLPWPFNTFFATFGNYWFLRVLHELGKGNRNKDEKTFARLNTTEAAEAMAMSTGPALSQIEQVDGNGHRYGDSVRNRIRDRGMAEKIRIYREGLFTGQWQKSLETTAALFELASDPSSRHQSISGSLLGNSAPRGALQTPTTLILGEHDPAFDRRLALGNVKDYLVKGSQVVLVKGAGHWLPLEPVGRRVLEKTVQWALDDSSAESEKNSTPFAAMSDVRIVEEL
ncbi:alpha/beta-hydrolase [Cucurbitaria berberidis CBS 394.84]|uniref:Alpha/beta-hydrolase n=1 Tax=Cucurbitaria berberidis CBS 394.84 TaxID=1168544 RepID=A0A9P4GCI8_9PLEO|nr:alpha/beta-hydrolase [Cucurbitaria berberidis CBS 394.84]KAF1842999.1 alpha/beta-hydrolase [Cucurbitaria berberidis CBS 394.84]